MPVPTVVWLPALAAVLALSLPLPAAAGGGDADKLWVFIGTYSRGTKSKGIYRAELDLKTGRLSEPVVAAEAVNPSFLAVSPDHKYLYAVTETGDFQGGKTGGVASFALDARTGELIDVNVQPSKGSGPCHVVVDVKGKNVLVANYGSGSAAVLPVKKKTGELKEATGFVQHEGKGANPKRQEGPHAHSINLDKANKYAFVADLGLDKVLVYKFDAKAGTLSPNDPPALSLAPGSGPRHFAFHPDGRHAYVINELTSTLTALRYHPKAGRLEEIHTVSTLPETYQGSNTTAEVVVHPSGKFVYGSNRGHDSIAVFRVDAETGKLSPAGHQTHGIKTPRNFAVTPDGRYLLAAGQSNNALVVFRVDPETGALTPTGSDVTVPAPVCVRMVPKAG